ncbi:hypothetical protein CDCA_CDCA02G0557 [Cyanidium caldarium]|uniref:PNPLA domain-containing protein n=1 Tax=Cyanidium caldarium TaxID=2771 RepID=A0AAV9IQL3_CYACA|nr:hypothetical protein CDCA_CDCA02G0557 [Cyanidium caldarium]
MSDGRRFRRQLQRLTAAPVTNVPEALAALEFVESLSLSAPGDGGRCLVRTFAQHGGFAWLAQALAVLTQTRPSSASRSLAVPLSHAQLCEVPVVPLGLPARRDSPAPKDAVPRLLQFIARSLRLARYDALCTAARSPLLPLLTHLFVTHRELPVVTACVDSLGTLAATEREFALLILSAADVVGRMDALWPTLPTPPPASSATPSTASPVALWRRMAAALGIDMHHDGIGPGGRTSGGGRAAPFLPQWLRRGSATARCRGIRILSLDGGGTRALISIGILRELERRTDRRIHQLFDLIGGTSTGGILAIALGVAQRSLDECEQLYRDVSGKVFVAPSNRAGHWFGVGKLLLSRGYYDSAALESLLRSLAGDATLIDSRAVETAAADPPHVFCVSTLMSHTPATPYLHTNYAPPPGRTPRYRYSAHHRLYEALRATSAAPTYFDAFENGGQVFCDGALLVNNPTAIAYHEARLLWPDAPISALVSVGTGRCDVRLLKEQAARRGAADGHRDSIFELARTLLSSATDTEAVHHAILDLTHGRDFYFRLNPEIQPVNMDEARAEKLVELQAYGRHYVQQHRVVLEALAHKLLQAERPRTNIPSAM